MRISADTGVVSCPWRVAGAGAGTDLSTRVRVYKVIIRADFTRCHLYRRLNPPPLPHTSSPHVASAGSPSTTRWAQLMRTSSYWIRPRFGLLQVASRHQLGLHVRDLVLFTISPYALTPSVDIIARTSSSRAYNYFLNKYDFLVPR
jgi:hypothetical protein